MKKELSKKISLMLCGALFLSNLVGSSFAHANPTKSTDSSDASMAAGEETTDKSTSEEAAGEKATGMSTSEKAAGERRKFSWEGRINRHRTLDEKIDILGPVGSRNGQYISSDGLIRRERAWSGIVEAIINLYKAMCGNAWIDKAVCIEEGTSPLEMLLMTITRDSDRLELEGDCNGSVGYPFREFARFLEKLIEDYKNKGMLGLNLYEVIEAINILFDKYKLNPMYMTAIVFDPSLF